LLKISIRQVYYYQPLKKKAPANDAGANKINSTKTYGLAILK